MSGKIEPILMPKWGLAMEEGMLVEWQVEEGDEIEKGQEIADIETTKITNAFESPVTGTLRKLVTQDGETVPVGFLLAVCAGADVGEDEIDGYVRSFKDNFVLEDAVAGAAAPEYQEIAPGQSIRYQAMGEDNGTPVVFIHGFGGSIENWMLNQEVLAEHHRTYAIDLPGHGGSTKDVGQGDLAAMTAALQSFMAAMEIEQAHLVGHSMGGGIALNLGLNDPGSVASLSLIAPLGLGPEINMDYIEGFISQTRARKLRGVVELLVQDTTAISADMIDELIKYKRLDGVDTALKQLRDQVMPGGRQGAAFGERDRRSEHPDPRSSGAKTTRSFLSRTPRVCPMESASVSMKIPDTCRISNGPVK